MKIALPAFIAIVLFASCQKNLSVKEEAINAEPVSSDVLAPLPCNTVSFVSAYPVKAGEVPPFRFTKTFYPSGRVKTINMLTRVYPIHAAYKKYAFELTGDFRYWDNNEVNFLGTREMFEYYRTSTGAAARRSIEKKSIMYQFRFNDSGYCHTVDYITGVPGPYTPALKLSYVGNTVTEFTVGNTADPNPVRKSYYAVNDKYGNNLSYNMPNNPTASRVSYAYDYSIPRGSKKYSFIPTQNLISQEYSLLEVMQWLPQPTHQRKSVAGTFYLGDGTKVVQSQVYKNYMFDAMGNQTSLTYGDNVLQKTTWSCK